MRAIRLFLLAALIGMSLPAVVAAQAPAISLTVSPSFLSLTTPPDTAVEGLVRVQNNGTVTEELSVGLMRLEQVAGETQPRVVEIPEGDLFSTWVTFSTTTLTVEPGRTAPITVTVDPPAEAALGYYYALTLRRTNEVTASDTSKVAGVAAVPILLEVAVADARRELTVVDFAADRAMYDFLPVRFRVVLKNSGNIHVAPRGNIFVTRSGDAEQPDAAQLALLEVNAGQGGYILPGTERSFETDWLDGFPHYAPRLSGDEPKKLVWQWDKVSTIRYGQYAGRLVLAITDNEQDIAIEGLTTFWIIPWQFIVGALLAIFFLYNLKSMLTKLRAGIGRLLHRKKKEI